jgi:large repetitive protein
MSAARRISGQCRHRPQTPVQPAARGGAQGYSRFIGRVGALALALGVGVGFTTAMPGYAWADDTGSSAADSSSPNSSSEPSGTTEATDTTPSHPTPESASTAPSDSAAPSDTSTPADDSSAVEPEMGIVQSTGGTHTGSYGPNATSSDDTETQAAASAEPDVGETTETAGAPSDSPAPPTTAAAPETPAPQNGSTNGGTVPVAPPPTTIAGDSGPSGDDVVDVIDDAPLTSAEDGLGDPSNTRSVALDTIGAASQLFAASNTEGNSAFATSSNASLALTQSPVQGLMAIPATVVNIAAGLVTALLSPLLAPGPLAPAQPPLTLFAVLDWLRREVQRTFFNRSPSAAADVYTTSEDVGLSGNVLTDGTDDTDADGDELTATLATGPAHGDVTLNPDGSFTYTPDANYSGADTFTYTVSDEAGGWHLHGLLGLFRTDRGHTDTATVTVNITAVNDAPVAVDDTATIAENTQASGNVLTNDSDVDSNSLTAALGTGPAHGTAVVNANGTFTYTPVADFDGTDTFTYTVSDGAATDSGTVTVTVTPAQGAPDAVDDTATVAEDSGFSVIDVLANDTDADGDDLQITLATFPVNGDAFTNNGTVSYRPFANFSGTETFTYSISDGSSSDTATVTVTVGAANDMPVTSGDAYAVAEDGMLTVAGPGVLGNDTDLDGDPLTAVLSSDATNGTLDLNSDGSFSYTPNANFTGTDSFMYYANDGTTDSNPSFVNITVTATNDAVIARDDANTTTANIPVGGNVLTNDIDENPDGPAEPLTITTTGLIATTGGGSVTMASDGTYNYNPATDFAGADTFQYTVTDGLTSDIGHVSITVTPAGQENLPPVANDDPLRTRVDTPLVITEADLVGNDTDADGDELHVISVTSPMHGTFTDNQDGTVTYTPDPAFEGTDTFTYRVSDGQATSNFATVTITVFRPSTTNAEPVAGWDSLGTAANTPLVITNATLLANDFDAEGDQLSVAITQAPGNGELTLNPDGSRTYTPDAGFTGTDQFGYVATDATGESFEAFVTIAVGVPANSTPQAADDPLSTPADTPLTFTADDLLANDFDADGDPLAPFFVSTPANGTLDYNGQDDTYTYTPNPGFTGTDTFYYTAYDGTSDSIPTLVTITVGEPGGQNIPPVANDDTLSTAVDAPLTITRDDLLGNDDDPDGDPAMLGGQLLEQPDHGTLATDQQTGNLIYTPDAGFEGVDHFTYQLFDGIDDSNIALVTITVGQPAVDNGVPVAGWDGLSAGVDSSLMFSDDGLLANDFDAEGDPLTVTVVAAPTHASLTVNPDGTRTYAPDAGFTGIDQFSYIASDGQADSGIAVVTVEVGVPANTAAVAEDDPFSTTVGTPLMFAPEDLVGNDFDADGDELSPLIISLPSNGTLDSDGVGNFVYTPDPGFEGTDTFVYSAYDGTADSIPATITITVGELTDNATPVPGYDTLATAADTPLTITQDDLLANDYDAEGDPLTVTVTVQPDHGSLTPNADGSYTYNTDTGYTGLDAFAYEVSDGQTTSDSYGWVTIAVGVPANVAPVAADDPLSTPADTTLTFPETDLLANDIDAEGGELSIFIVDYPSHGSLGSDGQGNLVYTPDSGFTGIDTFVYTAYDGTADSTPATVTITVTNQM